MSVWDTYQSRIDARGGDLRGVALQRERRTLSHKVQNSLSFHNVVINGEERGLTILNTDNLDQKTLCSLPGEKLPHGGIVEWMENHWLITKLDANDELYSKGSMRQCNYLLRWVSDSGDIVSRWCIVEDGTKYLTGEYGDNDFIIARGDSRITVTLPKDSETIRLNRDNRFLIDDYKSPNVLAYRLTKPFKLGGSYGDDGVVSFVMTECNTEDSDNFELHVANYYDHFPPKSTTAATPAPPAPPAPPVPPAPPSGAAATPPTTSGTGKKVWF